MMHLFFCGKHHHVKDISSIKIAHGFSGYTLEITKINGDKFHTREINVKHDYVPIIKNPRCLIDNWPYIEREFRDALNKGAFTIDETSIDFSEADELTKDMATVNFKNLLCELGGRV